MKYNGKEVKVSKYTLEELDKNVVIYIEESKKIIVLNETASLIWKIFINNYVSNNDISISQITENYKSQFNDDIEQIIGIEEDVTETINKFFETSLLFYN